MPPADWVLRQALTRPGWASGSLPPTPGFALSCPSPNAADAVRESGRVQKRRSLDPGRGLRPSAIVRARGFEPPTPRSRTECATRLRYAPKAPPAQHRTTTRLRGEERRWDAGAWGNRQRFPRRHLPRLARPRHRSRRLTRILARKYSHLRLIRLDALSCRAGFGVLSPTVTEEAKRAPWPSSAVAQSASVGGACATAKASPAGPVPKLKTA